MPQKEQSKQEPLIANNKIRYSQFMQFQKGQNVECLRDGVWWATKVVSVEQDSVQLQYLYYPSEGEEVSDLKKVRPRVEYVGWIKRTDSDKFANHKKYTQMGMLPLRKNQVVELVSQTSTQETTYQLVKVIEVNDGTKSAKVQLYKFPEQFEDVKFEDLRPTCARSITSFSQLNKDGDTLVDIIDESTGKWYAGEVHSFEPGKITVRRGKQVGVVSSLNKLRVGLEWIGGVDLGFCEVEFGKSLFEVENVNYVPFKETDDWNRDPAPKRNTGKKLTKQILTADIHKLRKKIAQSLTNVPDTSDLRDYERAAYVDGYLIDSRDKFRKSILDLEEDTERPYFDPMFGTIWYGDRNMRERGFDTDELRKGGKPKMEIVQPSVSQYPSAKFIRYPNKCR
eukprot:TRINITY_DN4005_c0_g1_i7.p2 TRINITY_DN4005_c0_g1~~TRINITY_DN4005_c0_g1_i7.p2  ORF type:complete len:395 (-),score=59.32 TRINITY_DN4005_c0_g1_i7:1962-3146(-)